jgi:hypothetical protein
MSCFVTFSGGKVIRRGSEPRHPATWRIAVWFVLPNGEKHQHSATIQGETVQGLVPVVGQIIDGLAEEVGNEVTGAGWTATTHGGKRKR